MEPDMQFAGHARPLTDAGADHAAALLGVDPAALWAVVRVETGGCGFLADRRPTMLFERHVFHRLTGGRYSDAHAEISAPTPGGYGAPGVAQYERLARAIELAEDAALRSASWGLGQIMGFNCRPAGYGSPASMITDFRDSEDAQLAALAHFVRARGLADELRRHDWTAFAHGYNGPDFATHDYDGRLARAHASLRFQGLPDLGVRARQLELLFAGLYTGC
jgi:N-acetylmuramidase-like protein